MIGQRKKTLRYAASVLVVMLVAGLGYGLGRLQGATVISLPPASWTGDSESAAAWRELATSMEAAGARVFAATDDPLERREGLEYLGHLLSASLEMKVARGNPAAPRFTDWMGDYRKLLGDSPDATYHTAEISSAYRYEIVGNIADADYLGLMLYGTGLNGWNRAGANLSHEALAIDEDGNFRVMLSAEPPQEDVDWLPLDSDSHMVMVRQYFHDRASSRQATLEIRALPGGPAVARNDAAQAASVRAATGFFNDTLAGTLALSQMLSQRPNDPEPPKAYNPDFAGIFYPTVDNQYLGTWFRVQEDEALVVEGRVPDAPYWSASLQNRWLQSLDYEHHQVSLNDAHIATADGRYRLVISHRKPAAGNWLDAAGHVEGLLAIRYQLPRGETPPPTLTLVKFDELGSRVQAP